LLAGSQSREYPLTGQIVAIDDGRGEMTVKHEDIRGFMPAMTMAFKVRDREILRERQPGDLITARLIVEETSGYLDRVVKTGFAPVPAGSGTSLASRMVAPGSAVPEVVFTDSSGNARPLSAWRGRTLALTFVYTRCPLPDFCPAIDRRFSAVQQELREAPELAERVHLVSVSFDPAYDTPQVLRVHAGRIGADPALWSYVTAPIATIDDFAAAFGVTVIRGETPAAEIVHNLRTAVIAPDGTLSAVLNGTDWTPEALLDAIRKADAER
jgi:protein SCO1/2